MLEFLFAFILVAAVIAVLFKPEEGGVIVLAVAMGAAFWYLGGLVEWHPLFFVFVVFVAAAIKIIDEVTGAGLLESELVLAIADMVLTRWQGGGGGGQGGPPTGRGGTGGGGAGEVRAQRRVQTGPQRHPPGQERPPRVFRNQAVAAYDVDGGTEDEEDDEEVRSGNLKDVLKDEFDR